MKNNYSSQHTNECYHSANKGYHSGEKSFTMDDIPPPISMPEYLDTEYASLSPDDKYVLGSTSYILPGSGIVEELLGENLTEAISISTSKGNTFKEFESRKIQMKANLAQAKLNFHSSKLNKDQNFLPFKNKQNNEN